MDVDQELGRAGLPEVSVATDVALDRTIRRGRARRRRSAVAGALALVVVVGLAAVVAAGVGGGDDEQVATGRQETTEPAPPSSEGADLLPAEPEPGDAATWDVVVDEPPSSTSSTFAVRVTRVGCNGGVTGRVLRPGIVVTDTEAVVTYTVEASTPPPGVVSTCQGNDEVRAEVDLGQPLGGRALIDGACRQEGEAGSSASCVDGGVRWAGVRPHECASEEGSDTDVATEPSWRETWSEHLSWTDTEGCLVRVDVLAERPGPEHCDREEATLLTTGLVLGQRYTGPEDSRTYVRDPSGAYGDPALTAGFDDEAELPSTAVDSGYRRGDRELWHDPSDPSAVWFVSPGGTERWPSGDPPVCR